MKILIPLISICCIATTTVPILNCSQQSCPDEYNACTQDMGCSTQLDKFKSNCQSVDYTCWNEIVTASSNDRLKALGTCVDAKCKTFLDE